MEALRKPGSEEISMGGPYCKGHGDYMNGRKCIKRKGWDAAKMDKWGEGYRDYLEGFTDAEAQVEALAKARVA